MNGIIFDGTNIQIETMKFKDFLEKIEAAKPLGNYERLQHRKGSNYFVVSLEDVDGAKDVLYFFMDDGVCYMQTGEGALYGDVSFMESFASENYEWNPVPHEKNQAVTQSKPESLTEYYLYTYAVENGYCIPQKLQKKLSDSIDLYYDTVDYMEYCFWNEFREGDNVVDGIRYKNAGDYCNARRNAIILTMSDRSDLKEQFDQMIE